MKPIYTVDKKAPRMRKAKYSKELITKELWTKFRQNFPQYKDKSDKELKALWDNLTEIIREEAITNPLGVKLASYMGELKLQWLPYKFEAKNKDNNVTEEVGKVTRHMNFMTKGKVAKLKWERRQAVKYNGVLQFYAFTFTRVMEKMAKAHIDKHPEKLRVSSVTLGGRPSLWRKPK